MSRIKYLNPNLRGRDFVMGDPHGVRAGVDALLAEVDFNEKVDRLFLTGDLGDRGPDSRGCIGLLKGISTFSVMGNHDMMLVQAAADPHFDWPWWVKNGGEWAMDLPPEELADLAGELCELPLAIVVGEGERRFNIIHGEFLGSDAELDAALAGEAVDPNVVMSLLWGRKVISGTADLSKQQGLSVTFCGHSVVEQPGRVGSQIFIDTGAYAAAAGSPAHALTMIEVGTMRAYQWRP